MSDTYNGIFLTNNDGTGKEYGGGGGNSGSDTAVLYTEQTLTSEQKEQARENIDSASTSELENEVATRNVMGAKNLLPNNKGIHTHQGITFTPNSEGKIIVSGEASADAYYIMTDGLFFTPKSGSYVISVDSPNPDIRILVNALSGSSFVSTIALTQTEATITIDYSNYDNILIGLIVSIDTNLTTPVTVSPMLRLASDADNTYEPYAKTNRELTLGTSGLSNPNLLTNPYFHINEKGKTNYTLGYCVNNWRIFGTTNLTINADKTITIDTTVQNEAMELCNFIDYDYNTLAGKTVTISANIIGIGIIYKTVVIPQSKPSSWTLIGRVIKEFGDLRIFFDPSSDYNTFLVGLNVLANKSITVKSIKMEVGSISTLNLDIPNDYATELARCNILSTNDPYNTDANKNIVTSASIKNISIGTSDMTTGVTVLPTGDLYIMYE